MPVSRDKVEIHAANLNLKNQNFKCFKKSKREAIRLLASGWPYAHRVPTHEKCDVARSAANVVMPTAIS